MIEVVEFLKKGFAISTKKLIIWEWVDNDFFFYSVITKFFFDFFKK
jgi:hypothetical protein